MKIFTCAFVFSAFVGCGESDVSGVTPDANTILTADTGDTGVTAPVDAGITAETYPAGPYGHDVGRPFRPFTFTACNRNGDEAQWRIDGPEFFTSQLTVIYIAAVWCVPCQRESSQIQSQIIDHYVGHGVRFVQLLVQNTDGSAISTATCQGWATRYGITFPVLMDPMFITQFFVPQAAFPSNIIIDRCGRIRRLDHGAETSLTSLRTGIDEVLADPRYPVCPVD